MEEEPTVTTEEVGNSATAPTSNRDLFGSDDDDDDDDEMEADLTTDPVDPSTVTRPALPATTTPRNASNDDRMVQEEEGEAVGNNSKEGEPNAPLTKSNQTLVVPEVTFPARDAEHHPIYYTKLPNLVGVQTEAFHPDTYSRETEEEEFQQASYNLIRWRYRDPLPTEEDASAHRRRESNTRLVEWDDGSYTLHVGKECFHVDFLDSSVRPATSDATTHHSSQNDATFAGLNGYLYLSQNAAYTTDAEELPPTPAGTVLECMGMVQQRLVVRPSSLQSEAHKSLTIGIRQKTMGKVARIAQVVTQEDPELQKQQRIKVSSDLDKAAQRKRAAGYYPTGGRAAAPRSRPRMSRDYLEDDEDYDTTRLKDMKRRVMGKDRDDDEEDMDDYGDEDEDDEEDTTFRKVRSPRGKSAPAAKAKEDSDDDVFVDDDDDDDEEDVPAAHLTTKKRSHQAVIDDDDDSD